MLLPLVDFNMEPEKYPIDGFVFGVEGAVVNGAIPVRIQLANGFFTRDFNNAVFESGKVYYFQVSHPLVKPDIELFRVRWDDNGNRHVLTPDEDPDSAMNGGTGNSPFPIILTNPVAAGDSIVTFFNALRNRFEGRNVPAPTLDTVTARSQLPVVPAGSIESLPVIFRNPDTGQLNMRRAFPGPLLQWLFGSALVADVNFTLEGGANHNTRKRFNGARNDQFRYHTEEQANGTDRIVFGDGFSNDGKWIVALDTPAQPGVLRRFLELGRDAFSLLNAPFFRAHTSTGIFKDVDVLTVSSPTKPITSVMTREYNAVTTTYQEKQATAAELATLVEQGFDFTSLAAKLRPYLPGGSIVTTDAKPAEGDFCLTVPDPPATAPVPYRAKITPAMIGVAQTHGLNAGKPDLIIVFQNSTDDPDTTMVLTFPTLNTYLISYPPELTTGYEGGKIWLQPI